MTERISVLFVCLGNICRSPLAEGVFRHLVERRELGDHFEIDSAGTSGYHAGNPPDARGVATARARGIVVAGVSRQIVGEDLRRYDYVIVMDEDNRRGVEEVAAGVPDPTARIHLLREWDSRGHALGVPDPYYGGQRGFDEVQAIVERSCERFLEHLLGEHGIA